MSTENVTTEAAAQVGNDLHNWFITLNQKIHEVAKYAAQSIEAIEKGRTAGTSWMTSAVRDMTEAQIRVDQLITLAPAVGLTSQQIQLAHSTKTVWFTTREIA